MQSLNNRYKFAHFNNYLTHQCNIVIILEEQNKIVIKGESYEKRMDGLNYKKGRRV